MDPSEDYSQTIIGRSAQHDAWVMARTPVISNPDSTRDVD
ncbi:MAG: lipocalin family protein [Sinobacteraceae bacterium]|nr:lipocalin family protein [Nevskiaceae bacterium]